MKALTLILMIPLISLNLNAQTLDLEGRTIVKDFPFCNDEVVFNMTEDLTVKTWDREGIRFMIEVKLTSHRYELIKELLVLGRYQIELEKDGTRCSFSMPELRKQVTINGLALEELIHITVFIPEGASNYLFPKGQIAYMWNAE
ncbi:MAG: hypothetical protein AAF598_03910 [Bacteroidota bacterium]